MAQNIDMAYRDGYEAGYCKARVDLEWFNDRTADFKAKYLRGMEQGQHDWEIDYTRRMAMLRQFVHD